MSRSIRFLVAGVIMLIIAIGFILLAFSNPMATLSIRYETAWTIYIIYASVMISMFIASIVLGCTSFIRKRANKKRG